jgi:enoyl-CoA hydratase
MGIKFTIDGNVGIITIDNPPVNALNTQIMKELDDVLSQIENNDSIKSCVITGAGMFFCAGADIKELEKIQDKTTGENLAKEGQKIITRIENMNKPFIAAINGACLGGGLELAMACHIRIASDRAKIGQPEINLGIIPGFGGTQRLSRLVGCAKAYELILTGEMILAPEAKNIGLVNKVVPETDVLKEAIGIAKRIAHLHGTPSIIAAMKSIREGYKISLEEGLKLEAKLFGELCETYDAKEGLRAFIEKRQPKFQNK